MLVMSMALVGTASAAPVWEGCLEKSPGTKYSNQSCSTALAGGEFAWEEIKNTDKVITRAFTVSLTDTKTLLGSSKVRCTAGGRGKGTVGPGEFDRIEEAKVENPKTNCARIEGGCKAGEVEEVAGRNLPWQTKLTEEGGKVLDIIENSGAGEPGWAVKCNTIGGSVTDECISNGASELERAIVENKLTINAQSVAEQLVLATFENKIKGICSQKKEKSGEVEGSIAILLANANNEVSGKGLRVS
jgi:hypothetical protein